MWVAGSYETRRGSGGKRDSENRLKTKDMARNKETTELHRDNGRVQWSGSAANAREYLIANMDGGFADLGVDDDRAKERLSAVIIDRFEEYIYMCTDERYFLMGESGDLFMYNGRFYEMHENNEDVLQNLIKDVMKHIGFGIVYQKKVYKEAAKQCISGMRVNPAARFTPDRNFVVFNNCVLDISKDRISGFSMDYRTDLVFDFDYIKDATYPLWDRIISETIPNPDMRTAFQMFCGAFLSNRKEFSVEYICYLIGTGRNGKSVVTKAIAETFGERLVSNYSPTELFVDVDKKYNRAGLVGKVANFSDDVSKKDYSGGAFKQFVSGNKISARSPYGKPFDLTTIPFMLACVNEMPPTTDDTNGHHRRILPIVCPNQVSEKDADPFLSSKLATVEAKSAIFNWVLEGFRMLLKNNGKICIGEAVKNEIEIQKANSNSARRWIFENSMVATKPMVSNDPRWKSMPEWMEIYRKWCREIGEPEKFAPAVGKIFAERGFESIHKKSGVYWNIGFLGEDTNEEGYYMDKDGKIFNESGGIMGNYTPKKEEQAYKVMGMDDEDLPF